MSKFELLIYWLMRIPLLPVIIFFSLPGVAAGLFLALKPVSCIELQKRFYAKINWRMEPISMEKEIRNTRLMGWFLVIFLLAALFLVFAKPFLL
jgi:hypothetical protein